HAEYHQVLVDVFGAEPFGIPVRAIAFPVLTVLYAPFVYVLFHLFLISQQAKREGILLLGLFRAFAYTAHVSARHPHLARSCSVCGWGLVYLICITVIWTGLTAIHR